MQFTKATRKKSKLRLCLASPSGGGKTMSALRIAKGLGGRIAVVDTERGSAQLYSDIADFDVLELSPPYSPERYIEVIEAAESAGYDTLILDGITPEWNGSGGILEIVDNIAKTMRNPNSYAAWNQGTPRHRAFIDRMLQSSMHVIATMRTKSAYIEVERNGKKSMQKQGTAPEQRDGIEYEFTAVLDLSLDGNLACATKDRTRLFSDPRRLDESDGQRLIEWLNSGDDAPAPEVEDVAAKVADHQAAIEAASSSDELMLAWNDAIAWAKSTKNGAVVQSITKAKDARKQQLSEAA
jgi:hypothetical protein